MRTRKFEVIADYGTLKVGDEFDGDDHAGYSFKSISTKGDTRYTFTWKATPDYVNNALMFGYLREVVADQPVQEDTTDYKALYNVYKESWDKTNKFLTDLESAYENDKLNAWESYADGNMAPDHLNEADTVYNNMLKLIRATKKQMA